MFETRRKLIAATLLCCTTLATAQSELKFPGLLGQPRPSGFIGRNTGTELLGIQGHHVHATLFYAGGVVDKISYDKQNDQPQIKQIVGSDAVCTRSVLAPHRSARWDCTLASGRRASYTSLGIPGAYSGQAQLVP